MLTNCRSFFFLLLILLLHDFAFRGPIQLLFWTIFATASSPKLAETRAAALPNMGFAVEKSKERKEDEKETPHKEGRRGGDEDCRGKELERAAGGGYQWNGGAGKAKS
ncbi:hypothetical protein CDL15_Pgr023692 [Punica granatum]|uniref:Secreted protein n=1 Tax=Punica granatum TaxID=22663 RepID=A0A218XM59_PUNGR|nr:hypothetical protein CDL15_Pgr023692 [Punica granatum]